MVSVLALNCKEIYVNWKVFCVVDILKLLLIFFIIFDIYFGQKNSMQTRIRCHILPGSNLSIEKMNRHNLFVILNMKVKRIITFVSPIFLRWKFKNLVRRFLKSMLSIYMLYLFQGGRPLQFLTKKNLKANTELFRLQKVYNTIRISQKDLERKEICIEIMACFDFRHFDCWKQHFMALLKNCPHYPPLQGGKKHDWEFQSRMIGVWFYLPRAVPLAFT